LINLNGGFAENPMVILFNETYLAVFDVINDQPCCFGLTFSYDGVHWSTAQNISVPGNGVRTPLALIPEPDGLFTLIFTRYNATWYESVWWATMKLIF